MINSDSAVVPRKKILESQECARDQKCFGDLLPKKMAICEQYRKCGKAGCRCINGELHGPYYFHFYRVNGQLKKTYIRKADAKDLWEMYCLRRETQRKRAADRKEFAELCRDLRRIDRMLTQIVLMDASGGLG
jgi:hypothetical protein